MVTFETQEDFEAAVIQVIIDKIDIRVEAFGHPFMTGVHVDLVNNVDEVGYLIGGQDSVS